MSTRLIHAAERFWRISGIALTIVCSAFLLAMFAGLASVTFGG